MTHTQSIIGRTKGDAVEYLSNLQGLIPPEVCSTLYDLAGNVPSHLAIVELGSFKGQSACCLAAGAQARNGFDNGAHVYAIDPWDLPGNPMGKHGYADPRVRESFDHQVEQAGLADHVTPIQAFSYEAAEDWAGPNVGLLYIDGDHREAPILQDFEAWEKHLAEGAIIVFDDLDTKNNPGVRRAVTRLARKLTGFRVEAGRLGVAGYYR